MYEEALTTHDGNFWVDKLYPPSLPPLFHPNKDNSYIYARKKVPVVNYPDNSEAKSAKKRLDYFRVSRTINHFLQIIIHRL